MLPILYSFRRCPYAIRARSAVVASGIAVELREIVLRDKPAALLAASPKATVPVLVLPDGRVIDQSLAIMHWALAIADPLGWLAGEDADLIATNDGAFKHHLDRYKYADRHGTDPLEHRAAATAILADLDTRLAATGHLVAPRVTLTDIAILPFVRQFAQTDRAWFDTLPLPALHDWLGRYLASSLFAAVMTRFTPWQPGAPTVIFPT
ncbi:glutathione S-transferase [Sphingomonas aerolata]|uniref:glutathione S-transferase n=1 Tax=Sphingomonas aerolata TaxID=185951 RepID=UPI00335E9751